MKRILRVVKKENFVPEQGYLILTEKGGIVYNGQIGLFYHPKKMGERLMEAVRKHGRFAIPNPSDFMRTVAVLEEVESVELDKANSALTIRFRGGKGRKDVPVVMNLFDKLPHFEIAWKDYEADKAGSIPISAVWREVTELITTEGEALWGNVIGVYIRKGRILSFDYGVYLAGPELPGAPGDMYCPLSVLDLGINDLEYAKADENAVYLVGPEVQYVCTAVSKSAVVDDMAKLREDFDKGKQFIATLDFTSGAWKRAKTFANSTVKVSIRDGEIKLSHESWSEAIGKTGAPDAEFVTRTSLVERWASKSLDHKISVSPDGSWYLHGTTRSGLGFYAILTDVNNPFKDQVKDAPVQQAKAEEADISDAGSLL